MYSQLHTISMEAPADWLPLRGAWLEWPMSARACAAPGSPSAAPFVGWEDDDDEDEDDEFFDDEDDLDLGDEDDEELFDDEGEEDGEDSEDEAPDE